MVEIIEITCSQFSAVNLRRRVLRYSAVCPKLFNIMQTHVGRSFRCCSRYAALACLIGLGGIAHAGTLYLGPPTVESNQTTVPVLFRSDGDNVSAMNFRLHYDPAVYEPAYTSPGGIASAAGKQVAANTPTPGEHIVVVMGLNQNTMESGEVARIVLRNIGETAGSQSALSIAEPTLSTPDGAEVPVNVGGIEPLGPSTPESPGQTPPPRPVRPAPTPSRTPTSATPPAPARTASNAAVPGASRALAGAMPNGAMPETAAPPGAAAPARTVRGNDAGNAPQGSGAAGSPLSAAAMPGGETQVAKRDAGTDGPTPNAASTAARPAKPRAHAAADDSASPGTPAQVAALSASQKETVALGGNAPPATQDYWALAAKFAVMALGFGAVVLGARKVYMQRRRTARLD